MFFIHIPKTGGVSFEHVLMSNYPEALRYKPYYDVEIADDPRIPRHVKLMYGHHWYSTLRILPSGFLPVTILRNPLDRFVSAYKHIQRSPSHAFHSFFQACGGSPVRILENEVLKQSFSDTQTAMLGADCPIKGVIADLVAGRETLQNTKSKLTDMRRNARVDEQMLDQAKKRLAGMPAFGMTEHFPESLEWIARTFRLSFRETPTLNRAPRDPGASTPVFTHEERQCIRQMNEFDYRLYEYAKELFEQRRKNHRVRNGDVA